MKSSLNKIVEKGLALAVTLAIASSSTGYAYAAVNFQDDDFHEVLSPGLSLDADNASTGVNIDITANQGSDNDGVIRYNAALNQWELSNDGGAFQVIRTGATTDADTFDGLDSVQFLRADTSDNFTSGTFTFDAGTVLDIEGNTVLLDEITNNALILDSDNTGGNVTLQFGNTLNETLTWDAGNGYFIISDDLVIDGNTNVQGNIIRLDSDNSGAGANVDILAEQGTDADGTLRYNATSNQWELSNDGGAFNAIASGDFLTSGASDSYTTGTLTFDAGTSVDIDGVLDASGSTRLALPAAAANPGTCTVGDIFYNTTDNLLRSCTAVDTWTVVRDGGDAQTVDSLDGASLLRSDASDSYTSGTLTFDAGTTLDASAATRFALPAGAANPGTCTVGDIFYNTTDNVLRSCTAVDTWTVVRDGGDSQTLDTLDSTQFARSDTSDNYTSGTMTYDAGTTLAVDGTLDVNGAVTFGDGGDDIAIDSNDWDISSAGVISGLTGLTSTGAINFSSASSFRIAQGASTPGTCTEGEQFYNTSGNTLNLCTATDTWEILQTSGGADANTLDGLDSLQFVRADTSDSYTSGTMTYDAGTTLDVDGVFDASGATRMAIDQGASNPGTCTEGDIFYNTTDDILRMCTATDTWSIVRDGGDATTLDTVDSTQILRSDTSDSFTSGTLTLDAGTTLSVDGTLDINGAVTFGDGGDDISIDSNDWDISSAGVASGFTGLTTTGVVDFSGVSRMALDQSTSNPGTCTEGDIHYNITDNGTYVCTATNTWTQLGAGTDADTLDTLDSTQFLRSDGSDNYTSGTLTFNAGTSFVTEGVLDANGQVDLGDNGDTVSINSSDWDITTTGTITGVAIDADGAGNSITNIENADIKAGAAIDFSKLATRTKTLALSPEYAGGVFRADGSNNSGTFVTNYDGSNYHNYYDWTTSQPTLEDYDIIIRAQLPDDFVSWQANPITFEYRTQDGTTTNNKLDIVLVDTAQATAGLTGNTALANASWTTYTSSDDISGGTWTAGSWFTIKVTVYALNGGKFADAGEIKLQYNGR